MPDPKKLIKSEELRKNLENLEKFFAHRTPANKSKFPNSKEKEDGVAKGFISVSTENNIAETYMIKEAEINQVEGKGPKNHKKDADRVAFVNEFVFGPIYKRLLYDKAPLIELVKDDKDKVNIHLRSEFIDKFQTIRNFEKNYKPEKNHPLFLPEVQGLEKVIATCMFLGDGDFSKDNLGVIKENDEYHVSKIDHGQAGKGLFYDPSVQELLQLTCQNLKLKGYEDYTFSAESFLNSLKEINTIDKDYIANVVNNRVHQLKNNGMKNLLRIDTDDNNALPDKERKIYDQKQNIPIEQSYINDLIRNKKNVEQIIYNLEMVKHIDKGGWDQNNTIYWMKDSKTKNPIKWAIDNNKQIDGQDPKEWLKDKITASLKNNDEKFINYVAQNNILKEIPEVAEIFKNEFFKSIEAPYSDFTKEQTIEYQKNLANILSNKFNEKEQNELINFLEEKVNENLYIHFSNKLNNESGYISGDNDLRNYDALKKSIEADKSNSLYEENVIKAENRFKSGHSFEDVKNVYESTPILKVLSDTSGDFQEKINSTKEPNNIKATAVFNYLKANFHHYSYDSNFSKEINTKEVERMTSTMKLFLNASESDKKNLKQLVRECASNAGQNLSLKQKIKNMFSKKTTTEKFKKIITGDQKLIEELRENFSSKNVSKKNNFPKQKTEKSIGLD